MLSTDTNSIAASKIDGQESLDTLEQISTDIGDGFEDTMFLQTGSSLWVDNSNEQE